MSQTSYRSGFRRTWVRLGERGRRDRFGARRGESLFFRILELFQRRDVLLELFDTSSGFGQTSETISILGEGIEDFETIWRFTIRLFLSVAFLRYGYSVQEDLPTVFQNFVFLNLEPGSSGYQLD